ncbi:MAG: acetyl-CoA carboxylase biotin carboxylase subunit [Clostridium sp.]|nr:acetyl-CoA carboxylase biotin carboxylase subunit [Clostridium sp.]MDY3827283.1 acetyl-CoA carboxylase biotin carboxylase subunit [Clostridium sp.]
MFQKILIANRGEIAVRIIRACREMGIETVAVYSEADKDSLHVQLADQSVCIGPNNPKDSYLNMGRILSATIASGATAIHPGFGFLSENPKFAKMCEECNIVFIGPKADIIQKLGDKSEARKTMEEAGVPVVPGNSEPIFETEKASKIAEKIGYPVIVKAVAGGGGKGMRIINSKEDFCELFETAQAEAENAFGNGAMYIEKYINPAKHVEFQILADEYGNVVHLGERDCSIQRKHQKMIEEAPSSVIDDKLREQMGSIAVKAAKSVGYSNAGTVEFILDKDRNFYFIEMNTRVQVEHGVSELVTNVDIIKEQIRIAAKEKLSLTQDMINIKGYAIEVRINAEDPEKNFRPSPGTVTNLHFPGGNGVRVDSALYTGYKVQPYYDSLIAKLMVIGKNRDEAISKMRSALSEFVVDGIKTNIDFQYSILYEDDYINNNIDTGFVEKIMR